MYDIAYLLSRLTRVGFSREQFSLECEYYIKLLRGIKTEYDTPEARRANAKVKRGITLSDEEQQNLDKANKKFIGDISWTDGVTEHEYMTKDEKTVELINTLLSSYTLLTELEGVVPSDELTGCSVERTLVNKLLKCSDAQVPYVMSQEVSAIISEYELLSEIKRFSNAMFKEIKDVGEKQSEIEIQSDWVNIADLVMDENELSDWNKIKSIITGNGWDLLDGGAIAVSIRQLFKCAVLSDRDYTDVVVQELNKCGIFCSGKYLVKTLIEQLNQVVFETSGTLVTTNSDSYKILVSCWLSTSKLLEEEYTEVGEEL